MALTRCPIAINELHASDIRGGLPIVHAFHTADRNSTQFQLLAAKTVKLEQRSNFLGSGYGLINGLVTTAGLALVLYVGGIRVLSGSILLGTLLIFVAYVCQMQGATGGLIDIFTKLKAAQASVERPAGGPSFRRYNSLGAQSAATQNKSFEIDSN